jgi:hypothetical protein
VIGRAHARVRMQACACTPTGSPGLSCLYMMCEEFGAVNSTVAHICWLLRVHMCRHACVTPQQLPCCAAWQLLLWCKMTAFVLLVCVCLRPAGFSSCDVWRLLAVQAWSVQVWHPMACAEGRASRPVGCDAFKAS